MARLAWLSPQYPGSRHGFQEKHPPFWARGSGISTQAPDTAHPKNQGDATPFLAEGVQSWHFWHFGPSKCGTSHRTRQEERIPTVLMSAGVNCQGLGCLGGLRAAVFFS